MLLKREIGPTIVGHWSGCGGGLIASRRRFLGRGSLLQFRNKSASISPPIILHFSRDRATIGRRLGHDRATIVVLVIRRSTSARLAAIPPCQLPDRGSIEPRSWSSSRTPPCRLIDHQATGGSRSRDRDPLSSPVRWRSNRADETRRHLSKENKLIS